MIQILSLLTAAGAVHANSTDEASLAQHVFPAGALSAGKIIEFSGAARCVSTNGTDTLTPRVRWGTDTEDPTANTEIAAGGAADVANDDVFIVQGRIHVQSTTRAVIEGYISECDANGTKLLCQFAKVVTLVPGTAYVLDITGDWSAAHADDQVQAEAFAVLEIA